MLNVVLPDEVIGIVKNNFPVDGFKSETVEAVSALGRVLHRDIVAEEDVPGFDRSTVDGYAVLASDTFGCSEGIPAVLTLAGEVLMGESAGFALKPGMCAIVSTGGEIPQGADAVVMLEFTEDYSGNDTAERLIGIQKPAAPGNNLIFKGDDVRTGEIILTAGTKLSAHDIGILAALGYSEVDVRRQPVVGIISTGNELVPVTSDPKSGQVRDVNMSMLKASVTGFGANVRDFGIIRDDEDSIRSAILSAIECCDIVLISGGSSAGARDLTARIIESEGKLLFHGIAMKPGKPTILGSIGGKPVFGLPGHPVAAYLVTELFVRPLIDDFTGSITKRYTIKAKIGESISSNHGRAEYMAVRLSADGTAHPVRGKSGLIASLAGVDGYICIPRDCEGIASGDEVVVYEF